MKTKIIFPVLVIFMVSACNVKPPSACIQGPESVIENENATYTWCGEGADAITWVLSKTSNPGKAVSSIEHGTTYKPYFPARDEYLIEAIGKKGNKSDSKLKKVEYGKQIKTFCVYHRYCTFCDVNYSGKCEEIDTTHYKIYIYNSKSDWVKDVKNKSHQLVQDSFLCRFTGTWNTTDGTVTLGANYASGSEKIISIEYINPSEPLMMLTNWEDIMYGTGGKLVVNNLNYANNSTTTSITAPAKKILSGTWKLTYNSSRSLSYWEKDDYIKFSPDGTWTYNLGNLFNNGSQPSIGTFVMPVECLSFGWIIDYNFHYFNYFKFATTSGTFNPSCISYGKDYYGGVVETDNNTIRTDFYSGTDTVYCYFTYQP